MATHLKRQLRLIYQRFFRCYTKQHLAKLRVPFSIAWHKHIRSSNANSLSTRAELDYEDDWNFWKKFPIVVLFWNNNSPHAGCTSIWCSELLASSFKLIKLSTSTTADQKQFTTHKIARKNVMSLVNMFILSMMMQYKKHTSRQLKVH